jgi:hypothetical protein
MEILHRRRRATVEEVRAELPDAPSPSSVRKLLDIMIDRHLLGREYDGPRFVYYPAATLEDASALKQLVRTFFDDSPDPRRRPCSTWPKHRCRTRNTRDVMPLTFGTLAPVVVTASSGRTGPPLASLLKWIILG